MKSLKMVFLTPFGRLHFSDAFVPISSHTWNFSPSQIEDDQICLFSAIFLIFLI